MSANLHKEISKLSRREMIVAPRTVDLDLTEARSNVIGQYYLAYDAKCIHMQIPFFLFINRRIFMLY